MIEEPIHETWHTEFMGNNYYIRADMIGSIWRYVHYGIPPGDFLQAVICNDLSEAVGRADRENLQNLPAFCSYFYNETPSSCWKSYTAMTEWILNKQTELTNKGVT
jgi:hypothetical protein